ncbi:unnamed protein product [Timema podura]|uniref:Generative cell specific-1/HAP2 domain-containing protein n=1 Tax=Timema podura TaxID=61482 RepID=A0ABN7NB07_TIMPD|nr:unnamed protein product [Timema podura]
MCTCLFKQVCVIYAVIPLMLLQDSESDDVRSESIQIIRQNKQNNYPIEIFAELHKCSNLRYSHNKVTRNYSGPPVEELGVDKDEPHFQDEVIRCYRKIVITLRINGHQKKSSNADYVIVDTVVIAGTQTKARLLYPIVFKVKQEEVLHLHELNLDTFVNGLAYEEVVSKEVANYSGCDDSLETPTCGLAVYHSSNPAYKRETMPYSQGFCCSCDRTTNSKRQARIHLPKRSPSYDTGDKSHLLSDSIKSHISSVDRGRPQVRDELVAPLKSHLSSMEQSSPRGVAALTGSEELVIASQRTKTRQGRSKRSMVTREGQLVTEGDGGLNLGADTYWSHVPDLQGVEEAPDDNTGNRIPLIPFKGEEGRSLADKADGNFKGRTAFDGDRMSLEKRQVVHGSLQARGGQSCADRTAPTNVDPVRYHESAHCLRFSDLWYAVYSLKSPIIDHSIHFQAFQMTRKANGTTLWRSLNDGQTVTLLYKGHVKYNSKNHISGHRDYVIRLNAESQKYVTSDAKMSARYSSFHGDRLIPSLLDRPEVRLLIPQQVPANMEHLYPQLQGGPGEWLVLNTAQISPDGQDCNKAGVGFQAFYNQPYRCDAQKNACLNNQPLHFWQQDTRAKKEGRRGNYFLDNYCLLPTKPVRINKMSKKQFLAVQVGGNQASSIVIEIAADDNLLVMRGMSGRLTEVHVDCTWPDKCLMTILASNLDLMSSAFTVRLSECPTELTTPWGRVVDTPAQVIPPYHTTRFQLELWGALPVSTMHCSALLINYKGKIIASRRVRLQRKDRCFCIWHCLCACIGTVNGLTCEPMSPAHYHAAGFKDLPLGVPPSPTSWSEFGLKLTVLVFLALVFLLFLIERSEIHPYGGKFIPSALHPVRSLLSDVPCIGSIGWLLVVQWFYLTPLLPCQYLEEYLVGGPVVYDEEGYPSDPSTYTHTRINSRWTEFWRSMVYYLLFPVTLFINCCKWLLFGTKKESCSDVEVTRLEKEKNISPPSPETKNVQKLKPRNYKSTSDSEETYSPHGSSSGNSRRSTSDPCLSSQASLESLGGSSARGRQTKDPSSLTQQETWTTSASREGTSSTRSSPIKPPAYYKTPEIQFINVNQNLKGVKRVHFQDETSGGREDKTSPRAVRGVTAQKRQPRRLSQMRHVPESTSSSSLNHSSEHLTLRSRRGPPYDALKFSSLRHKTSNIPESILNTGGVKHGETPTATALLQDLLRSQVVYRDMKVPVGGIDYPAGLPYSLQGHLQVTAEGYKFTPLSPLTQNWTLKGLARKQVVPPTSLRKEDFERLYKTAEEVLNCGDLAVVPKSFVLNEI